jgi:hypothetical protein
MGSERIDRGDGGRKKHGAVKFALKIKTGAWIDSNAPAHIFFGK